MDLGEEKNPITDLQLVNFTLHDGENIQLEIPNTVYPPREDTSLMYEAMENIQIDGTAIEIGCGSGILSILMAKKNWSVRAYDVNPYAVMAARKNSANHSVEDKVTFAEGGLGEQDFTISKNTSLIFWNLPYLNPPLDNEPRLAWMEEASMSDLPGKGWGHLLADFLEENMDKVQQNLLVILLQRKYPTSPSNTNYWIRNGWSHRILKSKWIQNEKLEVVAYWKPGQETSPIEIKSCLSTMDEAKKLPKIGWQRVLAEIQTGGRGRREKTWFSDEKDLVATWNINKKILEKIQPGIIQILIGSKIAGLVEQYNKWPNDIVDKNGKKIGGILIEMDNESDFIRIGIGINHSDKMIEGIETTGWKEKKPNISKNDLFNMVDAVLSTLFEEHELLKHNLPSNYVVSESWRGLSKLLSRGHTLRLNGKETRVIGINKEGELVLLLDEKKVVNDSLDKMQWLF